MGDLVFAIGAATILWLAVWFGWDVVADAVDALKSRLSGRMRP